MQTILIHNHVTKPKSKPSMLQWTPSTSNQSEDLSVHEIEVKKGMDEFSKVMDQFGEEHHWTNESAEGLEQWTR